MNTTSKGGDARVVPPSCPDTSRNRTANRLKGKCAIVTGADSGIGRAVAALYAREGADIAVVYSGYDDAAQKTQQMVEQSGRRCLLIKGNVGDPGFCERAVALTVKELGRLDILVSNADVSPRHPAPAPTRSGQPGSDNVTFRTHIYGYFYMAKACLPHLRPGSVIIATETDTESEPEPIRTEGFLDAAAPRHAVPALTRLLARTLMSRGIRVNAVCPRSVWTALDSGKSGPKAKSPREPDPELALKMPAQPEEIAPAYVFLASDSDSSYITGQVLPAIGSAAF